MSKVFDHLLPAFRTYALLSAEERIGWIRQARWINYSRADQIHNLLALALLPTVKHNVYTIANGLIERMDIKEGEGSSEGPSAAFSRSNHAK